MTRNFDLLDGSWYASQPFADWTWMRENAPAYWDAKHEIWAITRPLKNLGTIGVTVIAGPLNYVGVNTKVTDCQVPQPSP